MSERVNEFTKYTPSQIEQMVEETFKWYQSVARIKCNGDIEQKLEWYIMKVYPLIKDDDFRKEEERRSGGKFLNRKNKTQYFLYIMQIAQIVGLLYLAFAK